MRAAERQRAPFSAFLPLVPRPSSKISPFLPLNPQPSTLISSDSLNSQQPGPELKRWPWILLILVIVLGTLALVARPVAREVRAWQARRQAVEAEALASQGQVTAALKQLQSAALLSPAELAVSRQIARLLSAASPGEPPAVAAWARVLKAAPRDEEAIVQSIVQRLLGAGDWEAARRDFEALAPEVQTKTLGRFARGILAWRQGRLAQAREDLAVAGQLAGPRLLAGSIRLAESQVLLGTGSEADEQKALASLRLLQAEPFWAPQAGRLLREAHLRHRDFAAALREAEALTRLPEATAEAFLGVAAVHLAAGNREGLRQTLIGLRQRAKSDRALLGGLLVWLIQAGERASAAEIVEQTPEDDLGVSAAVGAAMFVLDRESRWERMRSLLRRGDWTGRELEREAWTARLAGQAKEESARQRAWEAALVAAGDQPALLRRLLDLARLWSWPREAEGVLARLALLPNADRRVLEDWWQTNVALRSARGIHAACRRLLEMGDNSLPVRNDYAAVALLLGEDLARAHRLALENFEAKPADSIYRTTYSASLRLQNRPADAWKVLLATVEESPALAFERIRVLAALGRADEARKLRDQVSPALLFPEQAAWWKEFLQKQ